MKILNADLLDDLTAQAKANPRRRLARYFGTTPEFWMNLQAAYELRRTRFDRGEKISREVQPHAA